MANPISFGDDYSSSTGIGRVETEGANTGEVEISLEG